MLPGENIDVWMNFGGGDIDLDFRPRLKEIYPISNPPSWQQQPVWKPLFSASRRELPLSFTSFLHSTIL